MKESEISGESWSSYEADQKYILTINEIMVRDERLQGEAYAKITNMENQEIWYESDIFRKKMAKPWKLQLMGNHYEIEMNIIGKNKSQCIGVKTFKTNNNQISYYFADQPKKPVWTVKYTFLKVEEHRLKSNNHFQQPSMIFKDIGEISRISNIKSERHNMTMERLGYSLREQESRISEELDDNDDEAEKEDRALVQQLKSLDKSLTKSFQDYSMQKKLCSQYVDESNNITAYLIEDKEVISKKSPNQQVIEEENDDEIYDTTQEKWFKNKYKGKQPTQQLLKRRRLTSISKPENPPKAVTTLFPLQNQNKEEGKRIISEFFFKYGSFPEEINVSVIEDQSQKQVRIAHLTTEPPKTRLKNWQTNIQAPLNGPIIIQTFEGNKKLYGCIGYEEQTLGQCNLFDEDGQIKGNVAFKCKKTGSINIQTQQILDQMGQTTQIRKSKTESLDELEEESILRHEPKKNGKQAADENPSRKLSFRKNKYESQEIQDNQFQNIKYEKQYPKSGHQQQILLKNEDIMLEKNSSTLKQDPIPKESEPSEMHPSPNLLKGKIKKNYIPPSPKQKSPESSQRNQELEQETSKQSKFDLFQITGSQYFPKKQKIQNTNKLTSSYGEKYEQFVDDMPILQKNDPKSGQYAREFVEKEEISDQYETYSPKSRPPRENTILSSGDNSFLPPRYRNQSHGQNRMLSHQNSITYDDKQSGKKTPLNFKIETVAIQLNKPIVHGKYLKFWIEGYQPYITETCTQINFPFWKGKGYFFEKVSEYAILHIQMYSAIIEEVKYQGKCTIYLAILPHNERKREVHSQNVREYLKNKENQILGDVILTYSFIEKASRSLSIMERRKKSYRTLQSDQMEFESLTQRNNIKTKRKKIHLKTQNARDPFFSNQSLMDSAATKLSRIHFDGLSPKNFLKGPPSPKRKYKGGNIIIPKAKRDLKLRSPGQPGPGAYEVPSCFDRHKTEA